MNVRPRWRAAAYHPVCKHSAKLLRGKERHLGKGGAIIMAWPVDPTVKLVLGILGNVTAITFFVSPLKTMRTIFLARSVGDFSELPYVMTMFNCLLWTMYGLPVVEPGRVLVSTINGTGAFFSALYIIPFLVFGTRRIKIRTAIYASVALLLFGAILLITFLAFHTPAARTSFLGITGLVVTIGMYASPLDVMRTVVRTNSVEFMPLLLSLGLFLNCLVWSAYATYTMDIYMIIPNGAGIVLGLAQLILYGIYSRSDKTGAGLVADSEKQMSRKAVAGALRGEGSDTTRHILGLSTCLGLWKDAISPEEMVVVEGR
ncbi:unnamed protein product [Closterium sp. Yama58-4]|nr:unnamed protein product [Closterium sp. Yama58-4]